MWAAESCRELLEVCRLMEQGDSWLLVLTTLGTFTVLMASDRFSLCHLFPPSTIELERK